MNKKLRMKVAFVCILLILVLVFVYSGLQILESTVFYPEQAPFQTASKTITRNGVDYYPRQDISVILLMGINQRGKVVPTAYNHGGAVDMVTLMVFDKRSAECTLLNLNRDMMVDMPMLNQYGRESGSYYGQLAYSHTYGDGMEDSCENVRKTVSNLLYGVTIDHYFSLNMDAIAVLNDAVGGVKVTVTDDFSQVDPQIPMGEVTLTGQQAVTYVQARWDVGDELNLSRMERQNAYMHSFVEALKEKLDGNSGFVVDTYEKVAEYIVTDCTVAILSRLEQDYGDYPLGRVLTVEGQNVMGSEFYEFYADEAALDEQILELFYAPK